MTIDGDALSDIRQTLQDALRRVDELRAEQSATAAPNPGSDGQRSGAAGKSKAYRGMEGPLCEAVHMAQIADILVDDVDRDDSDSREQLSFVVGLTRQRLEDLRRDYYAGWTQG